LLQVLQGVRLIKCYGWEAFYTHQIGKLRTQEVAAIRRTAMARSALIALVTVLPVLASILSFVTYALSGHTLDVATIFSSLQFFNIIQQPLIFFPLVLGTCSDAVVALGRIGKYLNAEELAVPYEVDDNAKDAVVIEGEFRWEVTAKAMAAKFEEERKGADSGGRGRGRGGKRGRGGRGGGPGRKTAGEKDKDAPSASTTKEKRGLLARLPWRKQRGAVLPTSDAKDAEAAKADKGKEAEEDEPFAMRGLRMRVPRGALVAVVGRIGAGKSSLLQALIGEMRREQGKVVFGGSVAYVPQSAWIMNATLRYVV
jgi:ATP-binding cassette subfamily C (CFTR/MRP) protein 1